MELKELAYIVQSLAIAVAVLVGGGWALFRYFSLRSIQHAQAALEKTQVEIERTRRTLEERGLIQIKLEAEQIFLSNDYLIVACATLRNIGNGVEIIDWSQSLMRVEKVIIKSDGSIGFSGKYILGERPKLVTNSTIHPGAEDKGAFIIRVPDSGIYYIRFESVCSPQATQFAINKRELEGVAIKYGSVTWGADIFFQVKDMVAKEADI